MGKAITPLRCHLWVILSIVLDLGVAALIVITYKHDILLPFPHNTVEKNLQAFLPTFGTLLGGLIAWANKSAITALITIHARRRMASKGLTFRQISHYDTLANGGIPLTFKNLFFFAAAVVLSIGFLTTAIVNSLTPTAVNWGVAHSMPSISFSADSGVTPPIYCELGGGNVNKYGYGTNCPLDNVYGEMYNAFTNSLRGSTTVNATLDGVSYPTDLIGISGSISTLTKRYGDRISEDNNRPILPTDTLDACVPRMIITANCSGSLLNGDSFNAQVLTVSGNGPKNIQQVSLCHAGGSCDGPRWAPNYGNGIISLFRVSDVGSGNTDVTIFSVGNYALNLTSPGIHCSVSAQEQFVPIRITGGLAVSHFPSLQCATHSPPAPLFLTNLTRLAGMGLEKMQGQDGKLEAISHIPDGQDRIQAIELGLERMVSIAATDMYSTIDNSTDLLGQWSQHQSYDFSTQRLRLGVQGKYKVIFLISPTVLLLLLFASWVTVAFRSAGNLGFNPLDPPSAIIAGMNRDGLPIEIANASDADQDRIQEMDVLLKYGPVGGNRMGMMVNGSGFVSENPAFLDNGYKGGESAVSTPMPTPGVHGVPTQYY